MCYTKHFTTIDIEDLVYKYTGNSLFIEDDNVTYKFGNMEVDVTKEYDLYFNSYRTSNDVYYVVLGDSRLDAVDHYNMLLMEFIRSLIKLESK